jgi:alanyl-tRNA synthetase
MIFNNLAILTYEKSVGQLDALPLRKRPDLSGETARIVEIEGYDWSLCCGTHLRHTGEIGMVKITGWENYKGGVRLKFCCGFRALRQFQDKCTLVHSLKKTLTAGEDEITDLVIRLKDDRKSGEKKMLALLGRVLEIESEKRLQTAKRVGSARVVSAFLGQRDLQEAQDLARRLVSSEGVVAVVGAVQGGSAAIFFARSDRLDLDVRPALQAALNSMNAKGGGSPRWAQCNTLEVEKLEQGIKNAAGIMEKLLSEP